MAALDAAIALAEVGDGARLVAGDLHLDVAGAGHPALDVEAGVAEGLSGLRGAALEGGVYLGGLGDGAHAPSAAPSDGLDDHAGALGEIGEEGVRLLKVDGVGEAGDDGDVLILSEGARLGLRAEEVERVRGGTDEGEARLFAGAGEGGALGKKTVAGVDGVAAGAFGGGDDLVDVEVGGDAAALEGADGIGLAGVEAAGVVLGVDGDGADAEIGGRAHDADGDLPTVRDEQILDGHGRSSGTTFQQRSILHASDGALRPRAATYHRGERRSQRAAPAGSAGDDGCNRNTHLRRPGAHGGRTAQLGALGRR